MADAKRPIMDDLRQLGWQTRDIADSLPPYKEATRQDLERGVRLMLAEVRKGMREPEVLTLGSDLWERLGRPKQFDGLPVRTDREFDRVFGAHCAAAGMSDE